jgi:hypothetical protein
MESHRIDNSSNRQLIKSTTLQIDNSSNWKLFELMTWRITTQRIIETMTRRNIKMTTWRIIESTTYWTNHRIDDSENHGIDDLTNHQNDDSTLMSRLIESTSHHLLLCQLLQLLLSFGLQVVRGRLSGSRLGDPLRAGGRRRRCRRARSRLRGWSCRFCRPWFSLQPSQFSSVYVQRGPFLTSPLGAHFDLWGWSYSGGERRG